MLTDLVKSYQAQLLGKTIAYAAFTRNDELFKAKKEQLSEFLELASSEQFKPIKKQYHKSYRDNFHGIANGKRFVII